MKTPRTRRRGGAALEYALVLPVLLAITFGIIDWSWYFFEWMTATRAAAQGVRIATGFPESADPTGRAEAEATRWLQAGHDPASAPVVTGTLVTQAEGTVLRLEVTMDFVAPIDLVWTPPSVRGVAEGVWYGDLYETAEE